MRENALFQCLRLLILSLLDHQVPIYDLLSQYDGACVVFVLCYICVDACVYVCVCLCLCGVVVVGSVVCMNCRLSCPHDCFDHAPMIAYVTPELHEKERVSKCSCVVLRASCRLSSRDDGRWLHKTVRPFHVYLSSCCAPFQVFFPLLCVCALC